MKKLNPSPYYLLLIVSVIFFGCKKSNNDPKPTPGLTASQWTFNGTTYKVTNSTYDASSNVLLAFDDAGAVGGGNYVQVIFGSIVKPSKNVTLTVVDFDTPSNPSNCKVQVGNLYDPYYINGHGSTGKVGDQVTVTVSPAGKLTASFSNVSVTNGPTAASSLLVSGTIIEN